ncbi:hypothetical protein AB0J83_01925 [Actinoplanes sp. NPDC049596]|uniref:hypothetical protein n=1 Tax=unclassified Actinoplanes TaxID=2626549 RepID=UPI00341DD8A0
MIDALVPAGGGVAGIAWELGVPRGLADEDPDAELDTLRPGESHVIWAGQASVEAFGTNPLSPATRGPAARAGRAVGREQARVVSGFLR